MHDRDGGFARREIGHALCNQEPTHASHQGRPLIILSRAYMARRFQFVRTPMTRTSQLATASTTEGMARAGQGCKIGMLDIANQFAVAPPGEYAEGRQTTTRQVW